jgi:hypothetical protein
MCAHMRSRCGLSGGAGSRPGRWGGDSVRWDAPIEAMTDLLRDAELAARESPRPGDQLSRTGISWSRALEDPQHVLCAVRSPCGDKPPVSLAQRLRGAHDRILPAGGRDDGWSRRRSVRSARRESTAEFVAQGRLRTASAGRARVVTVPPGVLEAGRASSHPCPATTTWAPSTDRASADSRRSCSCPSSRSGARPALRTSCSCRRPPGA